MKNKGIIYFTIALLIVVILLLGIFLYTCLTNDNSFLPKISISAGGSTEKVLDKSYEIEEFRDVKITVDASNVEIKKSEDGKVRVIAYNDLKNKVESKIEENTLMINEKSQYKLRFSFGVNNNRRIELYLPEGFSNKINVNGDSGNFNAEDFENATYEIKLDAGNVKTGKVKKLDIKTDAGNTNVDKVEELKVETDAGNVKITEITKKCNIQTDAGNVKIANLNATENSSIKTDMGNVNIENSSDVNIEASSDVGNIDISENNRKSDITVTIRTDVGNINVD